MGNAIAWTDLRFGYFSETPLIAVVFCCVILLLMVVLPIVQWLWRLGEHSKRHVLITGCDTGFGFLLAKRLDTLGFLVFAGCLTHEGVERLRSSCSDRVTPLLLDVSDIDSIHHAVNFITLNLKPNEGLWSVVNNAGIMPCIGPLELIPRDCLEQTLRVNLLGMVDVTRACLPLLRKTSGRLINMSSVSGRLAFISPAYTMSKFAVEGFSDSMRRELWFDGITVSTIVPGGFQTNILDLDKIFDTMQSAFDKLPLETQSNYGTDYVQKRSKLIKNLASRFGHGSTALYKVTNVYEHALTARFPKRTYIVGHDATFCIYLFSLLPSAIGDYILRVYPICRLIR